MRQDNRMKMLKLAGVPFALMALHMLGAGVVAATVADPREMEAHS